MTPNHILLTGARNEALSVVNNSDLPSGFFDGL